MLVLLDNYDHSTSKQDQRIAKMTFASIYPHYVNKIEKKNRSKDELHRVIEWLTGFNFENWKNLLSRILPLKHSL